MEHDLSQSTPADCYEEYVRGLEAKAKELELYKSKTPHTADGKPVTISDIVWSWNGVLGMAERVTICRLTIHGFDASLVNQGVDDPPIPGIVFPVLRLSECYSTREALEAAQKEEQA